MITAQSEFVCVEKLKKIIEKPSNLVDFFSPREIAYCNRYKDRYITFAGILAAKIAFIKTASNLELPILEKIEVRHKKKWKTIHFHRR